MIIVHMCRNYKEANRKMKEFADICYMSVKRVIPYKHIVVTDSGEHHFISENDYPIWCKGKTYRLSDGTLIHSGHKIEEQNK